jgi:IS5 family transposase
MRPKSEPKQPQRELFQVELEQIIDVHHPLVRLGMCIDWTSFEQTLGSTYHPTHGGPGISTRLMVALHYLKYQHDLSDENVLAHWVENPCWQRFSGERYFQHRLPIDASSMTRWRARLGEAGPEQMLRETIAAGIKMGSIGAGQLKRINVDTTVETKPGSPATGLRRWGGRPGSPATGLRRWGGRPSAIRPTRVCIIAAGSDW